MKKMEEGEDKNAKKTKRRRWTKMRKEWQEYIYYHISDAVIEPDDEGQKDKKERNCVLMRHSETRKPED